MKNFRKFFIYSFTVLCTKLLYDVILKLLPVIKSTRNPYFDVAIGMVLALIIFYPIYAFTRNWMERFSHHYIKYSGKLHRNRLFALVLAYLFGMLVLFACFLKVKFDINIISDAARAIQSL